MFDGKFIATLFAVAISVFAICNINTKNVTSTEGFSFNLPSTTTRKEWCGAYSWDDYMKGKTFSLHSNKVNELKLNELETTHSYNKGAFVSTPNFQGMLSPRFDPGNHGPLARVNFPDSGNMAAPAKPLDYVDMVKEGFRGKYNGCMKVDNVSEQFNNSSKYMEPNFSDGNYKSLTGGELPHTADLLPLKTMAGVLNVDENGQPSQCIFFERIIHSNRNNRLRSQGDPIRGDLPIKPVDNGWFNPPSSVEDLRRGALEQMGGSSESSKEMAKFIEQRSGNRELSTNTENYMPSMRSVSLNGRMNTVQATSY